MSCIAGIDEDETLRVVRNAMQAQQNLLRKYVRVLRLYVDANEVAMQEVDKLRRDRSYWKRLANAGSPYRIYAKMVHQGPRTFMDAARAVYDNCQSQGLYNGFGLPRYSEEDIDRRLAMIERMLFKVHMFTGALHEGASYLKRIYLSCVKLDRASALELTPSADSEKHTALESKMNASEVVTWLSIRKDLLRSAWSLAIAGERLQKGKVTPLSRQVRCCLGSLSHSLLEETAFNTVYDDALLKCQSLSLTRPFCLSNRDTQRPSTMRRYWLHWLGAGVCATYCVHVIAKKQQNGDMARYLEWFRNWRDKTYETHCREPFDLIQQELFQTLKKKSGIVSEADLVQSNKTLDRMLRDFEGKNDEGMLASMGLDWVTQDAKRKMPSFQALSEEEQEKVMATLMDKYEDELKSPLRGLMFGSLMTAMLIQMQKLKVHTEAAYLSMDQVIESNNLTMAISAAVPAVALAGLTFIGIKKTLYMTGILGFEGQRQAEEMLRLKMVELDRALLDAYAPSISELDQAVPSTNIVAPTPSSPQNHNHRQSFFSKNVVPMTTGYSLDRASPPPLALDPLGLPTKNEGDNENMTLETETHEPFQDAAAPRRISLQRTPSYSLSSSGRLSPENILMGLEDEDEDNDVAGLASYESSLNSKGRLAYELFGFHKSLRSLFVTKMPWSWYLFKQNIFTADWRAGKIVTNSADVSVYNSKWENEYVGLSRDVLDLSSPDFEIGGRRKISTAARMRVSYACLKAPGGPTSFMS